MTIVDVVFCSKEEEQKGLKDIVSINNKKKEEADILKQSTSADDKIVAGIGIQIEETMHPEANHQETHNLEGEIKYTYKRTDGKIVAEIVFQIDHGNIIRQQLISQRANTTASDIWNDIKELAEPRIVISIVGAYNELISSYEWKHQLLLQDALTHVTRYAGKCGFLYKTMDMHLADTIIQKSVQC
ncbi:Hypothetical predicted protein [Mytilus galloprovincialis]|uniref:Uncharacterized protein n=1 Tax=Mytilus galloprovincialis TaxID=29158 RepID=A0A8B6CHY8_MYTGA|nr:Hypothetical predicted protein [Mytilus galloprovincialis]